MQEGKDEEEEDEKGGEGRKERGQRLFLYFLTPIQFPTNST